MKKYSFFILGIHVLIIVAFVGNFYRQTISQINQDPNIIVETTSKIKDKPLTFMISGDTMLGRAVAWKFKNDVKQAFTNLGENFFGKVDIGILNLEGPISATVFKADPNSDNLVFNFPPQSTEALNYLGVKAISLANNHSYNQGEAGFENTVKKLTESKITPIGSQTQFNDDSVKEFGKISVIAVNLTSQNFNLTDAIKTEKQKGEFVFIFPHWGNEYQANHSSVQEKYAHTWIDAGADLVIGAHPHVVQDAEIYQGKPIFYSLGNLIFDQSFSTETQQGLIITGEISKNKIKITVEPTIIKNYQVELADGTDMQKVIDKFKTELANVNWQDNTFEITK